MLVPIWHMCIQVALLNQLIQVQVQHMTESHVLSCAVQSTTLMLTPAEVPTQNLSKIANFSKNQAKYGYFNLCRVIKIESPKKSPDIWV